MTDSAPLASAGEPEALATIDLSAAPETTGGMLGRIIGGALLFIVAGLFAIGCGILYLAGPFIPAISDWADLLGDGALFVGAIAAGLAITGFELMRRGRKRRAANVADAATAVNTTPGVPDAPAGGTPPVTTIS